MSHQWHCCLHIDLVGEFLEALGRAHRSNVVHLVGLLVRLTLVFFRLACVAVSGQNKMWRWRFYHVVLHGLARHIRHRIETENCALLKNLLLSLKATSFRALSRARVTRLLSTHSLIACIDVTTLSFCLKLLLVFLLLF